MMIRARGARARPRDARTNRARYAAQRVRSVRVAARVLDAACRRRLCAAL